MPKIHSKVYRLGGDVPLCGTKGKVVTNFWYDKVTCLKCLSITRKAWDMAEAEVAAEGEAESLVTP